MTVERGRAFWDAFEAACDTRLVPQDVGEPLAGGVDPWGCGDGLCSSSARLRGRPFKLFPRFVDAAAAGWGAGVGHAGAGPAGAEAGEGHGPRKEFFTLAGTDMAQPRQREGADHAGPQHNHQHSGSWSGGADGRASGESVGALFTQIRSAGHYWVDPQLHECAAARRALWFAGWLLAQAVPNRARIGLQLSPALFEKLAAGPAYYQVRAWVGCRQCL